MALQVGLLGIGGGMGYAIFLMLCLSYSSFTATGTAMFMTVISTLVAAGWMVFRIPETGWDGDSIGWIIPGMILLSMAGTWLGAKLAYSFSEQKVNILIGIVVIAAGFMASLQRIAID